MSTDELRAKVRGLMPQAKDDLAELVAIRSVADPEQFPPEECERAAQWLIDAFSKVGLSDLAAHETPDGSKAVFGQAPAPPGAPTVMLYCHYDVQPPLDEDAWETPAFELTERDGRWFGRGSADCKGNIVMHLIALRALGGGDFPVGVKLIAEGSEEQGTGGLEEFVPLNADLLRADAILICEAATPPSACRR
jgi:cysteinylglycine-S-conjugate dipeptidase